jgi:hypothetical protein
MDYGTGIYKGIEQFNSALRREGVCSTIEGSIRGDVTSKCWASEFPAPNNGVRDPGEECDHGADTTCCKG